MPQKHYSNNIKDSLSPITTTDTMIMEQFEILLELPKCDREIQREHMLLEK